MQHAPKSRLSKQRALPSSSSVLIGFLGVVIMLGFNAFVLYRNMEILRGHQQQMRLATEILAAAEAVLSDMKDAETAQRGFQITGVDSFLEPYGVASSGITATLSNLRLLSANKPTVLARVAALESRVKEEFDWLQMAIETRRSKGLEGSLNIFNGHGKALMDSIRETVSGIRMEVEQEHRQIQEQVQDSVTTVDRSFYFVTLANLALAFLSFFFVRRSLMQQALETARQGNEAWLRTGLAAVSDALLGDFNLQPMCQKAANIVASYTQAPLVNIYTARSRMLYLQGSFGGNSQTPRQIAYGDGLVGAAANERRLLHFSDVPSTYVKIASSTGSAAPAHITIVPLSYQNVLKGILEVASFQPFTPQHLELLEAIGINVGTSIDAAENRGQLQELLEETQRQAEELQSQQEELRVGNEELESQAIALKEARDVLQVQQEELQQTNEELEQQARALEMQKQSLLSKNNDLEKARRETEAKAKELEISGRYKSEFLANMSHELRTPLNSLLILATLLAENQRGHLDEKELEFARTIHRAGSDLLNLINDILDLSKVEAGKLDMHAETFTVSALLRSLAATFEPMAAAKGLGFHKVVAQDVPKSIHSDMQRLEQILRNFLSNSVKFTSKGDVTISVAAVHDERGDIAFSVKDTGIGIAEGSIQSIFEAFQQADGSTSREFGGTGLGLTISRELASLLGGSIEVASTPGEGSTFTLYLPSRFEFSEENSGARSPNYNPAATPVVPPAPQPAAQASPPAEPTTLRGISGDTDLKATDRIILIIEDDADFADTLVEMAHEGGFKALSVSDGETGLTLLDKHVFHAVILDVKLPDVSGLSILERIKSNPKTRHLPIHMISGLDHSHNALQLGAIGYLLKPASVNDLRKSFVRIEQMISKTVKKVLIVEDDTVQRQAVSALIGGTDIETVAVGSGADALKALSQGAFDCLILDLKLPDISGFDLLEQIEASSSMPRPPVVVYTGKDLSKAEIVRLQRYSESIVIKGARSPERLLDEVSLFLHRVEADMPQNSRAMLQAMREREKIFAGKRVLVVDDDMRNVFALANALERRGLKIIVARDGREALQKLSDDPDIHIVLMDIMMPHMDGFEATRRIRSELKLKKLPIIALTAKAMRGDQEKCLEAGANDYLPKPVDLERLLSLMRVWLPHGGGL